MSANMNELTDLLDLLSGENFSFMDDNGSHVETVVCQSAFNQRALLYTLSILYIFIFVIGLAANALVVWVNVRGSRERHETHLYVLNLAIADLCVVATLPVSVSSLLQHGHWPFGDAMCKITHLVFSVNLFGSIFFLTCMSVDRYLSVVRFGDAHGGQGERRRTRQLICMGVWLLALLAALPDTYFLQAVRSTHSDATTCRSVYPAETTWEWMVGVQLSSIALGFAVPFPVIVVFYVRLARAVRSSADHERRAGRRLVFTYVMVFLACWLPFHGVLLLDTLALLGAVPLGCTLENVLYVALHVTQCLSLLHCCVNPVIYNFIDKNYRYDLMKAFIFKYSTKTGLARLIDTSRTSETECSAMVGQGHL
ncbi:atypical chemokine receptor 3b [Electrophorus electricus]|uniref:G-protein coupled receptors family 1 profile domain-containing protein n=1 Tax=Electrophorus electricus TaxID=8005 RepID=A0A4W4GKS1_ELEEL|nr:atypical chemokine receptor 3b [Electrophorus electricus]